MRSIMLVLPVEISEEFPFVALVAKLIAAALHPLLLAPPGALIDKTRHLLAGRIRKLIEEQRQVLVKLSLKHLRIGGVLIQQDLFFAVFPQIDAAANIAVVLPSPEPLLQTWVSMALTLELCMRNEPADAHITY